MSKQYNNLDDEKQLIDDIPQKSHLFSRSVSDITSQSQLNQMSESELKLPSAFSNNSKNPSSPFFFFLRHRRKILPISAGFSSLRNSDMKLLLQTNAQKRKKEELRKRYEELKKEKRKKMREIGELGNNREKCMSNRGNNNYENIFKICGIYVKKKEIKEMNKIREKEEKRRKEKIILSSISSHIKSISVIQNTKFDFGPYKNALKLKGNVVSENLKIGLKERKLPFIFKRKLKTNFLMNKSIKIDKNEKLILNYDIEYGYKRSGKDDDFKSKLKSHHSKNKSLYNKSLSSASEKEKSIFNSSFSSEKSGDSVSNIINNIFPENKNHNFSKYFFILKNNLGIKMFHIFGIIEGIGKEKDKLSLIGISLIKEYFGDKEKYLSYCGIFNEYSKGKMNNFNLDWDSVIYALTSDNFTFIKNGINYVKNTLHTRKYDLSETGIIFSVVILIKHKIISIQLGDVKSFFIYKCLDFKGNEHVLSICPNMEHTAKNKFEKERIEEEGGIVEEIEGSNVNKRALISDSSHSISVTSTRILGYNILNSIGIIQEADIQMFDMNNFREKDIEYSRSLSHIDAYMEKGKFNFSSCFLSHIFILSSSLLEILPIVKLSKISLKNKGNFTLNSALGEVISDINKDGIIGGVEILEK